MGWIALHALFWAVFLVRGVVARAAARSVPPADAVPRRAPFASGIVALHAAAAGVFYVGLLRAVLAERPRPGPGRCAVAVALHVGATALALWAVAVFRSWRVRAELDVAHELATTGPFALVRHPIYLAMLVLVTGAALVVPTPLVIVGAVLVGAVVDVRARGEEQLLTEAFGDRYRAYAARVPRFVPGVY